MAAKNLQTTDLRYFRNDVPCGFLDRDLEKIRKEVRGKYIAFPSAFTIPVQRMTLNRFWNGGIKKSSLLPIDEAPLLPFLMLKFLCLPQFNGIRREVSLSEDDIRLIDHCFDKYLSLYSYAPSVSVFDALEDTAKILIHLREN